MNNNVVGTDNGLASKDDIYSSYPDSGTSYKKLWVRSYILVPHFILRRMVNMNNSKAIGKEIIVIS
ncbi:hypothetical protein EPI10_000992 [Gossypium australe]|uniref:Uncharacterized protein n=1 Tax=Gossypium australe TaxID=47621 RepID=A0A5B6V9M8_9ROSI|nr:hypothetical protein EPI10_000992 [Gossypium australe]